MRRFVISVLLTAIVSLGAFAQFDFGGGGGSRDSESPPWTSFKLNPKTRIKLDFRNANVDSVLSLFQRTSGVTIVKDPSLTGSITVTTAKAVSLNDAFAVLQQCLNLRNYEMTKSGNMLVIRQRQQRGGGRFDGSSGGFDPSALGAMMGGGRSSTPILKVYPLQYANATQLARVLNEVFTPMQSTSPLDQLLQGMAGAAAGGNQGGPGGGGRRGMRGMGGTGNRGGGTGSTASGSSNVRASADDFSNSVIVNAPEREQGEVKDLITQLDKQTDQPQKAKVYKLQYALATDLATVVQNVLTANAPRGRGGLGSQNVPIEQRFQQAFRLGSTQAAFGTVVADSRTNSLVVTATDENLVLVDQVLKDLDQDVPLATSTFVFQLSNARSDDVAQLLYQAFGPRSGAGSNLGSTLNRNTTTNRNTNTNTNRNNNNNNRGGGGGTGLGGGLGMNIPTIGQPSNGSPPVALPVQLADPNADSGDLKTNVTVSDSDIFAQFGGGGFMRGGGFGQGNQGSNSTSNQTGRDAQGHIINVRDLTGQVTTISDPNTNSIIVVTSPENADLIKKILEQLDKLPQQVMIETVIVEATLDASTKMGIEWNYNGANLKSGQTGSVGTNYGLKSANPALEGLRYSLTGGNLEGLLNALATDTKFQVLSTPRIFTSNNVQAEINISQSIPYVLSTREDANGNLTYNYAFQDVGIVLTVTPRITANGFVAMDVNQTANDLQGFTSFNAPIVNQRQATTTVSVKDGDTVILGGIIRNTVNSTVNKVPILGDIPILGNLFRSTSKEKQKTELMVFLTPHVVKNADEAKKLKEDQSQRLSVPTKQQLKEIAPNTVGNPTEGEKKSGK